MWCLQFTEGWSASFGSLLWPGLSCFSCLLDCLYFYIFYIFLLGFLSSFFFSKCLPYYPFVVTQGFPTRLPWSVTTKPPFLLCHAVEKLLASKFSLSSTSELPVLLPLGSFQRIHVRTEAPVDVLVCLWAIRCSRSQREHRHIDT